MSVCVAVSGAMMKMPFAAMGRAASRSTTVTIFFQSRSRHASARLTADSSREAHMAQRMSREFVRKA